MFVSITLVTNLSESEQLSWDVAKQIIESQGNLAMIGISVLVGITVLLVAGSLFWNFYLHKHELERAIKSFRSEITVMGEESFVKLTERIKDETEKMKETIEKSVAERMTLFDAEKARLFALTNEQMKIWENAVVWWAEAIEGYAKAGEENMLRTAVDALIWDLGKCKKFEDDDRKRIKECSLFIPKILEKEKEQIEEKLSK